MKSDMWYTNAALNWLQQILFERFGVPFVLAHFDNYVRISLAGSECSISILTDEKAFSRRSSDGPCARWEPGREGWGAIFATFIPAPGVGSLPNPLIKNTKFGYEIGYDILGLTYWMLSREEEVGRKDLDSHGRFPARSSNAYRHGYLERPIVDEWLDILSQVVRRTWPMLTLKRHHFCIKVSHDVDTPSMYGFKSWSMTARMMAGHLLKRRDLESFFNAFYVKVSTKKQLSAYDRYNTFDWLMDQSEVRGLTSAFYFICGQTDKSMDAEYELQSPVIRKLLRRIHERGHEIGLHPSYCSYKNAGIISSEARNLFDACEREGINQVSWGARMHYLRWETPTTPRALAGAGIAYDSTLGYADHPGFRCGTCYEYPAYDPVDQCALGLRIRPLIVMEGSIISSMYLGLGSGSRAKEKIESLKEACRKVDGCFTLLWHNSFLEEMSLKKLYINSIS